MFEYQFVLNYMSRATHQERIEFLKLHFKYSVRSFETFVDQHVKQVLAIRSTKRKPCRLEDGSVIEQERSSKFILEEQKALNDLLTG